MKIVLATGIYPPDIGGPATYAEKLAEHLKKNGHEVTVITYQTACKDSDSKTAAWPVIYVAKNGGPWLRWRRYAAALREHAADTHIVVAFSSVSCGVPLRMAKLKGPKKILRLGGDFFWERYTAGGGTCGLQAWHAKHSLESLTGGWVFHVSRFINRCFMPTILKSADFIVYSTAYQQRIHQEYYNALPPHTVIENSLPVSDTRHHEVHDPLRLLYLGRFVGFKNIPALVGALALLPHATLTLVGEGPERKRIDCEIARLGLGSRVTIRGSAFSEEKRKIFEEHDLFVLPSITEISPNAALEARGAGLPVLLTEDTGLSDELTVGMIKADLRTPEAIATAIRSAKQRYLTLAEGSATPLQTRSWDVVAGEWMEVFSKLTDGGVGPITGGLRSSINTQSTLSQSNGRTASPLPKHS